MSIKGRLNEIVTSGLQEYKGYLTKEVVNWDDNQEINPYIEYREQKKRKKRFDKKNFI